MTSGSPEELRDLVLGEGGQRFAPAAAHQREALAALHDLADEVTVDALARERVDDDGRVAGGRPRARSSASFSRAMIAAPSSGTPLVSTTASPTRAPPVVTSRSFATSPSIAPTTIGRSRPCVISVWPPTSATSSSSHAAWSWSKSDATAASVVAPGGSRSVARNQRGRAPRTAMSLALTWSAYQPISSVAKVIGSVVATR